MKSDTFMSDQQHSSGGLAQLFIAADSAIERRRTDNIFKQLDERSLTEDEERIIQQRIELQRKLLQEYEKREQKRKVTELQDLWPDLSEAAAIRALEICHGKEDEAVLRLTEDGAFKRRVLAETGTYTPVTVLPGKGSSHGSGSRGSRGSSNAGSRRSERLGSNARVFSPSKLEGNVFVGRFRSKLGPCQERAVADAAAAAARAAAAATVGPDQPQPRRRGRPRKIKDPVSQTTAATSTLGVPADGACPATAVPAEDDLAEMVGAAAASPLDAAVASNGSEAASGSDRLRSTSPECEEDSMTALEDDDDDDDDDDENIAEEEQHLDSTVVGNGPDITPMATDGATPDTADDQAAHTDVGTDTDAPGVSERRRRQQQVDSTAQQAAAARVSSMMARQIARLEPLLAAGRLLDFEMRRPGSSELVLDLLASEYGEHISGPISTAWEVLLEEQKWKEAEGLAAMEASRGISRGPPAAAAAEAAPVAVTTAAITAEVQQAVEAPKAAAITAPVAVTTGAITAEVQQAVAAPTAATPAHLAGSSIALQQILAQRFGGVPLQQQLEQAQQQQQAVQQQQQQQQPPQQERALTDAEIAAALAAAAGLLLSPEQQQEQQHGGITTGVSVVGVGECKDTEVAVVTAGDASDDSTLTEPTTSPVKPLTTAAAAAAATLTTAALAASSGDSGAAQASGSSGVTVPQKRGRGRPPKRQAAAAAQAAASAAAAQAAAAAAAAAVAAAAAAAVPVAAGRGNGVSSHASRAISETGHTCRGRVRQKSHKTTELVELGTLVPDPRWYNAGYIFPAGFKSRLLFRSSVDLDALTLHECEIVGEGGKYWPSPTFVVTARDREEEPIVAKSCTGCWSGILKRINAEIQRRIELGEPLPPPPRTAIAGPEYFGLNDTATIAAIETLDPDNLCTTYWVGKQQREAAAAGMPVAVQPRPGKSGRGAASAGGRKRGRRGDDADDEGEETGYKGAHWSSISRRERYMKRCAEAGDEAHVVQEQQLLPGVLDPITLEPVVNPAISPAGHVMGLATWKAVLAEQQRCPFTKAPLRADQLIVLTVNNIDKYSDRIIAMR